MIVIGSVSSSSVNGSGSPFESRAAIDNINLLFPSPGSPCNRVTLPNGIYGYHSHFTSFGSISLPDHAGGVDTEDEDCNARQTKDDDPRQLAPEFTADALDRLPEIGRASCRERVLLAV